MVAHHATPGTTARRVTARQVWVAAGTVAVVVLAVIVWGGYAMGWTWTGLSDSVTLWDWLEVLALPVAVATAPLFLRHRRRLGRRHRIALAAGLAAFAALVIAGYLLPMRWTGFTGNTLWDWLELILLPVVVTTSSLWIGEMRSQPRHRTTATVLGAAFLVLVVAGYLVPLRWTGFTGNTVWDWIKLLLLPVLVPVVLVPLVAERMNRTFSPTDPAVRDAHR